MNEQFHVDHFPLPGLSAPLIEAANTILAICLFWMLVFGAIYFGRLFYNQRARGRGIFGSVIKIYETAKPEIALTTIIGSLWMQRGLIAYLRHAKNAQESPPDWVINNGSLTLVATTVICIIGSVCWIRVISPFSDDVARWLWLGMVSISLAAGFWFAYLH